MNEDYSNIEPLTWEGLIDIVLSDVREEVLRATSKFGPFRSAHEGWAVLREEVDELWEEVKHNDGYGPAAKKEALQCAAMGIRYVIDCCISTPEDRLMKSFRPVEDHDYSATT